MAWRAERSFRSSLETPGDGRAFVESALGGRVRPEICQDCELMASELLTNSVKASSAVITVALFADDSVLRLEVSDDGGGTPTLHHPTALDTSGRGLLIVAALAEAWGIDVDAGQRTTVWVELPLSSAASPARRTSSI